MVAAEGSVPGDALYQVKVGVNENIRSAMALSGEAKANWEARVAERRLEEAEKLTAEGELSIEAKTRIEVNFGEQAERVRARIEALGETDTQAAADIAANFETSLRAHERILARLSVDATGETRTNADSVLAQVRVRMNEAAQVRAASDLRLEAASEADLEAAAKARVSAAANAIKRAEKNLADVDADVRADVEARFETASEALLRAETSIEGGVWAQALQDARLALSGANEVNLLINSMNNLDLEVDLPGAIIDVGGQSNVGAETRVGSGNGSGLDSGVDVEGRTEADVETAFGASDGSAGASGSGSVKIDIY